ncbi:MAG TPA: hypothetical protein VGY97_10800 [Solirubrobacteraceae bacterium]|nr:hypothetical protein [Solirubrobacteraceae bacterium]
MTPRQRLLAYGGAAALVVAAVVIGVTLSGVFAKAVALALGGLGLVLAVSLVFLEVGLSEDHERAREEESRRAREERERVRRAEAQEGQVRLARRRPWQRRRDTEH